MDEKTKTPIELMADLLATMTARAIEAERQRDEAEKSSDEWYQNWQAKDAALSEIVDGVKAIEKPDTFSVDV